MKYYTCLPTKCLEVLKQLQIDLTILNNFKDTLKQINVIKYFPSAINNASRFREILLRYLEYFAKDWRLYRVIKDQIHGGPQRIAFVLLQQLNAEAEQEFVTLAANYKHLNLENEQTMLKQSMKRSIRVQTNSIYQSQKLTPKQNVQQRNNQNNQNVQNVQNNQIQMNQNQQQIDQYNQYNQYYQQQQMYYQQYQTNETNQLKQQIENLQKENQDEKEKRKCLQQQLKEESSKFMNLQKENNQLKQQINEQKTKEKSSRSKDEKKLKEIENEKMRLQQELEDLKHANELLQQQIDQKSRVYEDQIQQMRNEKIALDNLLLEEKQKNQQLREEMNELKKKQVDYNSKEETKEFDIPLQYFYDGTPYVFNHQGLQFSIPTIGQIEDEKRYTYNGYGTPLNGQARDLVVVSRIKDDGDYEREGYNLIKKVFFEKSDVGKEKTVEIILPNLIVQQYSIVVQEAMYGVEGFGLLDSKGMRGSLVIDVQLI